MTPKTTSEALPDMRHILIGQLHSLIDLGERYAARMQAIDPDEQRYAEGAVDHARKVIAPYTYNGPTRPEHAALQPPGDLEGGAHQPATAGGEPSREEAAADLLNVAHVFWKSERNAGQQGAVKWLQGDDGSLVIFTRGEYREELMANIGGNFDKVHHFADSAKPAGEPLRPNDLALMAQLMDEAASNIRLIPEDLAEKHQVRHYLPDELEGSAIMIRNALLAVPAPTWECPDCHKWPEGCEVGKCAIGCRPIAAAPAKPAGEPVATAAAALIDKVLEQCGGYLSGPGFEAAELARKLKSALAAPVPASEADAVVEPIGGGRTEAMLLRNLPEGTSLYVAPHTEPAIAKVRGILERMNRKGGLGHDVHGWIGDALDALDSLAPAEPAAPVLKSEGAK